MSKPKFLQFGDRRLTFHDEGGMSQQQYVKGIGWVVADDQRWTDFDALLKNLEKSDFRKMLVEAFGQAEKPAEVALKFRCPNCKCEQLECIQSDASLTSKISVMDEEVVYEQAEIGDATIDRFQCDECGWKVPGITDEDDLIDWLKENQPK